MQPYHIVDELTNAIAEDQGKQALSGGPFHEVLQSAQVCEPPKDTCISIFLDILISNPKVGPWSLLIRPCDPSGVWVLAARPTPLGPFTGLVGPDQTCPSQASLVICPGSRPRSDISMGLKVIPRPNSILHVACRTWPRFLAFISRSRMLNYWAKIWRGT